jgi:glycosyltransferase involved in cell wall biosynthesis
MDDFIKVIQDLKPDIILNQMPYEKPLRKALSVAKVTVPFKSLGCLNNSLFSFKSNIKEILKRQLPSFVFPLVNNTAGINYFQSRHRKKHSSELLEIMNTHDWFVLPSPKNFDELRYFVADFNTERVTAIPNSIPGIHDECRYSNKEKILLFVGRVNVQQKRADLLLKVWNLIHNDLPDWKFVLLGDGPYLPALKEEAKLLKLDRVQFEGFQSPDNYYRAASVFIMPSSYEGFPSVLLEAQSFGLVPVVFDSYAAVSWILNNNEDAFLAKPYDIEEMAMKIKKLATDDNLLNKMKVKAFSNAERFTIENVGREWMALFQKCLASV